MTAVHPLVTSRDAPSDASDDAAAVSRRIAQFERTGNPETLWPGVTERARVVAAAELERVTRDVLACRGPVRISNSFSVDTLGVAGYTTGMGPAVGRWIENGDVEANDDVAAIFARHIEQGRRRAARIERDVLPALEALLRRDIPVVALKGAHVGRAYYEEFGMRRQSDVDILVPSARVDDVEAALRSVDFRPNGPRNDPYKRDWIAAGVDSRFFSLELADARTKWMLEVHVSLDRSYHRGAVARLDGEREATEPFVLAGRDVRVLAAPLLLVYLACHCAHELENTRLLRVYEMVRVIRADRASGRLDWDDVLSLLRRTESAAYAYPALSLVENLAPGTVDARVLDLARGACTWAARETVRRLSPSGGSLDARDLLRQLMWARSPSVIAQRLLRVIWPPSITTASDVAPVWRARLRRARAGLLSIRPPDEHTRHQNRQ